jgi:hypothetical protein
MMSSLHQVVGISAYTAISAVQREINHASTISSFNHFGTVTRHDYSCPSPTQLYLGRIITGAGWLNAPIVAGKSRT